MILLSVFLSHIHTSLNTAYYLSGMMMMVMKEKKNGQILTCVGVYMLEKKIRDVHIENLSLSFFFTAYICLNIIFILCIC
jgi:hypothetical protein